MVRPLGWRWSSARSASRRLCCVKGPRGRPRGRPPSELPRSARVERDSARAPGRPGAASGRLLPFGGTDSGRLLPLGGVESGRLPFGGTDSGRLLVRAVRASAAASSIGPRAPDRLSGGNRVREPGGVGIREFMGGGTGGGVTGGGMMGAALII